jgi:hypothetical protein
MVGVGFCRPALRCARVSEWDWPGSLAICMCLLGVKKFRANAIPCLPLFMAWIVATCSVYTIQPCIVRQKSSGRRRQPKPHVDMRGNLLGVRLDHIGWTRNNYLWYVCRKAR